MVVGREKFNQLIKDGNLPKELLEQLNIRNENNSNIKILKIFEVGGGTLNVSEVLVGMYSLFGEIKRRTYISATMYKMKNKGLLIPTGKKGEYSTKNNA